MRLFNRKKHGDEGVKCLECGERAPDGAAACSMCGGDLVQQAARRAEDAPGLGGRR